MAGILDNKTRILDVIVTREGKRQIAQGKLVPRFLSFSDGRSFYQGDPVSGSTDASERGYHEATSLPADQITLEADDTGQLVRYDGGPLKIIGEYLYKQSITGSNRGTFVQVSGSTEFASLSRDLLSGTLDNFKNQMLIGTIDTTLDDQEFRLSENEIKFLITDQNLFQPLDVTVAKIQDIEPLFLDYRLHHVDNFQYLPPVSRPIPGMPRNMPIGRYPDLRQYKSPAMSRPPPDPPPQILDLLGPTAPQGAETPATKRAKKAIGLQRTIDRSGRKGYEFIDVNALISERKRILSEKEFNFSTLVSYLKGDVIFKDGNVIRTNRPTKPFQAIEFSNTSRLNNIVMQMFEISGCNGTMTKLDVIDFGEFNDPNDSDRVSKRVFFAGKVYLSESGIPTFVNLFTIVID